jgi:diguanylate cyclase (GGDEF)-like protein
MNIQTTYAIMYLEINLFSVILVAIIGIRTAGLTKMVAQRNFAMSICAEIVFFLSDTMYVLMAEGFLPYSNAGVMMLKSVYFFSTALMCFYWFLYFEHLQGSSLVMNRKYVRILAVLVVIMAALLIVNVFSGILFYVDKDGVYRRGPFFVLQYVLSYIYVLITCGRALVGFLHEKEEERKRLLLSLVLFPIAPALAGILQFVYPQLPVACGVLSLATLIMYLGWMEQMISIDPLTRLNNRKQLTYQYEQWARNPGKTMQLVIVDANRFKHINDTYGHLEGDAALVRIAEALRRGCTGLKSRASIGRYGGDEFIILLRGGEDIEALCNQIDSCLENLNKEAGAGYDLTVCYGVAKADRFVPLKELVERADDMLYERKRTLH